MAALILALPTYATAQNAIDVDASGNVSIPGTLTAGAIQSNSLSWVKFADNLYDAMIKVNADPGAVTTQYEFMINRNNGMRVLHFSSWNGGLRAMTDPYMTGDSVINYPLYRLGGSMWAFNNPEDPPSTQCDVGKVLHRYYFSGDDGFLVSKTEGNGCSVELPVYARKRSFK